MSVLIILMAILFSSVGVRVVDGRKVQKKKQTIVIDSGHGGIDSGKVSVLGDYEKDINLSIAKRLEKILKKAGYNVVMTRKSDEGLYSESSTGKKSEDMRKRCAIIDSSDAVAAIQLPRRKCKRSAGILLQKFRRWKTACRMLTRVIG